MAPGVCACTSLLQGSRPLPRLRCRCCCSCCCSAVVPALLCCCCFCCVEEWAARLLPKRTAGANQIDDQYVDRVAHAQTWVCLPRPSTRQSVVRSVRRLPLVPISSWLLCLCDCSVNSGCRVRLRCPLRSGSVDLALALPACPSSLELFGDSTALLRGQHAGICQLLLPSQVF